MPITDVSAYRTLLSAPAAVVPQVKTSVTMTTASRLISTWTFGGTVTGAVPSTAGADSSATAGALGQQNAPGGTDLYAAAVQADLYASANTVVAPMTGVLMLFDRLSDSGGLAANVLSAQTTNLPTAALTRYTSGVGVWAFLEIYTIIGATATTFTASYTNQAGTSGQTSQARAIGAASRREVGMLIPLNLAAGDTGVRSVESVTLAGTTGTAGNFGVTLAKPLLALPIASVGDPYVRTLLNGGIGGGMPRVEPDACLFWAAFLSSADTQTVQTAVSFGAI